MQVLGLGERDRSREGRGSCGGGAIGMMDVRDDGR